MDVWSAGAAWIQVRMGRACFRITVGLGPSVRSAGLGRGHGRSSGDHSQQSQT